MSAANAVDGGGPFYVQAVLGRSGQICTRRSVTLRLVVLRWALKNIALIIDTQLDTGRWHTEPSAPIAELVFVCDRVKPTCMCNLSFLLLGASLGSICVGRAQAYLGSLRGSPFKAARTPSGLISAPFGTKSVRTADGGSDTGKHKSLARGIHHVR